MKLVAPKVAPATASWESGLPVEGGRTAPFIVDRGWVGPAGTYIEEWSIRRGDEILYRHPPAYISVRGHQSVRRFTDTVQVPVTLQPGIYDITFVVERYRMGSFTVDAASLAELHAAAASAAAPPAPATPAAPAAPAASVAPARPAPAAAPTRPAAAPAPAAPVVAPGEDPAVVRERVYQEELAKGSDPRVAQARAKSAEMRAKKAASAAAEAESAPAAAPVAAPPPPAPVAQPAAPAPPPSPYVDGAPEGGGGMTADQGALAASIVYKLAIEEGLSEEVATARAKAAEVRAQRGVWWRPDW
ncbi:MAG TPA: hypothetical protein VFW71_00940 [Actinomycetota bacterium]|nr:hypothetical protein [Actinomycetota bacterium]